MNHKLLFLLVEGNDDERFFQEIILPIFEGKNNSVKIWKYAQQKDEKIKSFLRSIKSMGADYIYVTDINNTPCVTKKKEDIQNKFENIDINKIIVVIQEVEGWYIAGLNDANSQKLDLNSFESTDDISKEQFNNAIPKKFGSRIDFMKEILKNFSIEIARQKNKSFKYFFEKYDCDG